MAGDLFDGHPLGYALDDGMPFPGWAPPAIDPDEASERYDHGDRFAVLAGPPADPVAALVVDRRNARAVLTVASPRTQLVFAGRDELALTGATWRDPTAEYAAERVSAARLRVRSRPVGCPVWLDELLANAEVAETDTEPWPPFGSWSGLARLDRGAAPHWWDEGGLDSVDADGWLLDELADLDLAARWRDLARKYDAPRAWGQPPEVQAKIAEERGWRAQGRKWRRVWVADGGPAAGASLVSDVTFVAGAGGGSDVALTVEYAGVQVVLTLPAATARIEGRSLGIPKSPAQPRPSASAQVAVAAVLDLAGEVHDSVAGAIGRGALPAGWARLC